MDILIDFKAEIAKYKPIMEVDQMETSLNNDYIRDLTDLLRYVCDKGSSKDQEEL